MEGEVYLFVCLFALFGFRNGCEYDMDMDTITTNPPLRGRGRGKYHQVVRYLIPIFVPMECVERATQEEGNTLNISTPAAHAESMA